MTAVKIEEYERPQITCYGDLTELTEGQKHGNHFDASFVVGQPIPPAFLSCLAGPPACITLP
jgi:hypothetical protein